MNSLEERTKELELFKKDIADKLGNIIEIYKEQKSSNDVKKLKKLNRS